MLYHEHTAMHHVQHVAGAHQSSEEEPPGLVQETRGIGCSGYPAHRLLLRSVQVSIETRQALYPRASVVSEEFTIAGIQELTSDPGVSVANARMSQFGMTTHIDVRDGRAVLLQSRPAS